MNEENTGLGGIAVVGMAGRFPGAQSIEEFWGAMREGRDAAREFAREDLERLADKSLLDNPRYVKRGYVLDGALAFDPACFGYTPAEARSIDPQQRWLLQTAWEALEDAGYAPKSIPGDTSVGVFASISPSGGLRQPASFSADPAGYMNALLGCDKDYAAARIAYKLNLHGPAMAVQTACSSSLVGVAQACQSLMDYGCDMALAGGCTIVFPQEAGYLSLEEGGLSADGYCHAFDHRASGMNFGNGCAMLVLKRLEDALEAGDHVYGVIRGFAVNNDGSDKVGFTAPSVSGQRAVIEEALAMADVPPESVTYIEAHGTGTPMGDPIEVKALAEAYGPEGGPCELGSVKANVGHLNAAAGAAGLVKAMLCLEHAEIPPLLHFERPNPALGLEQTRFTAGAPLHAWTAKPRRAGVSSFGLGGTNCHLVVEQAPEAPATPAAAAGPFVLPLSARSEEASREAAKRLAAFAGSHPDGCLADVARTLQTGREAGPFRKAAVASSLGEAAEIFSQERFISQPEGGLPAEGTAACFLFPGAGSQQVGMGRDLYRESAVFRDAVDRCAGLFLPLTGWDVRDVLYPEAGTEAQAEARMAEPLGGFCSLFAVEYAMLQLWRSFGVEPACAGGHSFGQYAAAVACGVMELEDAVRVVVKRGQLMDRVQPGGMLLVFGSEQDIAPMLSGSLSLAVVNTPRLCTVAGEDADIEALQEALRAKRVHSRRVEASRPGHSCFMDPILDEFRQFMATVPLHAPRIPLLSNVTGGWATDLQAQDPEAWTRHIRQTVRFYDNMGAVFARPDTAVLEAGPGRVLTAMLRRHPAAAGRSVVPSMRDQAVQEDDWKAFLAAAAGAFCAGIPLAWPAIPGARRVSLPPTPFDLQDFEAPEAASAGKTGQATGGKALLKSLMNKQASLEDWFFMPQWTRTGRLHEGLPEARPLPGSWLVFVDCGGIAQPLADMLAEAGVKACTVREGEAFSRQDDGSYRINPVSEADYAALLKDLAARSLAPERIVHAWTLAPESQASRTPEALQRFTNLGYASLVCLARGLTAAGMDQDMGIAVLTSQVQSVTGQETLVPEKSLVLGPCRVMPSEYRGIQTLSVDVECGEGPLSRRACAEAIRDAAAIPAGQSPDGGWSPAAAYRAGFRFEQRFAGVRLPKGDHVPLREGGCYLVTGGFGGVAGVLSEHLARTRRARLVLTGRSALPGREDWDAWLATHPEDDPASRRIRRVRELEAAGAEVLALQADAGNAADMERVFAEAERRFGRIDGVFHAASVAASSMIQAQTQDRARAVLGPKVYGALNIEAWAARAKPDFVLLFSSISSHVGALGHTDYTAACLFLDTMANALAGRAPYRILAVNWGYWQGVGIGVKLLPKLEELLGGDIAVRGILPEEGMQCIERVLSQPVDQVVVSTSDYAALIDVFLRSTKDALKNYETYSASSKRLARPQLTTAFRAAESDVEKVIAGVWQELLGFEAIGVDDNFFELGGDSLHALPMVGKLEEIFRIKVPVRAVITENTIAKLAVWLSDPERSKGRTERIAQLYLKVKGMSPEEVRQMMEARKKRQDG